MVDELLLLRQKAKELHGRSPFDVNDLRKSIFGQYYQILNAFLGGFCFVISDQAESGFEITVFDKTLCRVDPFSNHDLENMFLFYLRNMCSEFIECVENLLGEILKNIFPAETENNKEGYIKFSKILSISLKLKIITVNQRSFLSKWAKDLRNPRHSNYVDRSNSVIRLTTESFDTPFSIKNLISPIFNITSTIISHPTVKEYEYLEDRVRKNNIAKDIELNKFSISILDE